MLIWSFIWFILTRKVENWNFFNELKVARKAQLVYLAAEEIKLTKFTKLKDGLGFKIQDNDNGKIIVTKKTKFCTGSI